MTTNHEAALSDEPETAYQAALPSGTELQNFRIERVLGVGSFGITYLAFDSKLNQPVAIKEYFPNEFAVRALGDAAVHPKSSAAREEFAWGLERFLQEAQTLARFSHPNIVRVRHFFEANGPAYMVMDYEEGQDLAQLLKSRSKDRLDQEELMNLAEPLLDGLAQVHAAGFLHRDIKPANIYLRSKDNSPVLIDFGAARIAMGSRSRPLTTIYTPGYGPFEQTHPDGDQGPWSDIYALGAVLYRAITGRRPKDARSRDFSINRYRRDPLESALEAGDGRYSEAFLAAIDWALHMDEGERPQDVASWLQALRGEGPAQTPEAPEPPQTPDSPTLTEETTATTAPAPRPRSEVLAAEPVQARQTAEAPGRIWRHPATGIEFVRIPAGSFQMGSPDSEAGRKLNESPVHEVRLDAFLLGKFTVTQGQWRAVMGDNPAHFQKGDDYPVERVSWNDAQGFIRRLHNSGDRLFRLPTEAEWEYACRAGTQTPFHFGETLDAQTQANYNGKYPYGGGLKGPDRQQTTPVGSFPQGNRI